MESYSWILNNPIKCVSNWAKPADSKIESVGTITMYTTFGSWMSPKTYLNAEDNVVMECFVWGISGKTITVDWFKDDDTIAIIGTANEVSSPGPPSF